MPDQSDQKARRIPELEALQPEDGGARGEVSSARLHVRENFDALVAARGRGVSWQQIVTTMNAAGVRSPDGSELDWRQVASLFHAERYARGGRRKRRLATTRKPQPAATPEARPAPTGVAHRTKHAATEPKAEPPPPAPTSHPASPYAEIDRQQAEAKRRRAEAERARDWNPYALPQPKDEPNE